MKLDHFYHLRYWDDVFCYTQNILADMPCGFLQVFPVECDSLHIKKIDWEEPSRIRRFLKVAHMLGNSDLLSRSSVKMNTI